MIPRRNQIEVLLSAWQELETRPVYVVAAERYHLHGISKPGLFDWIDQSRHYIGPLDAMKDKRTREVNMLKPVRGGGSVCGDAFLQYVLENDPGDYMQVLQTDDEVSQYASKRTIPNLEKSLRWMLPKFYPRGEGEIKLLNGYSLYISGPSISNMQTKMIRYMHLDEPHMYKKGTIGEAKGRLGDYLRMHLQRCFAYLQGGPPPGKLLDDHDWFHHYNEGEINEWEAHAFSVRRF
jgi:phage terminase large subunit GpA-like protein